MKLEERMICVLIVGSLPLSSSGIATTVAGLSKSNLAKDFKVVHVDNSTRRSVNKKGKIDILNVSVFIFHDEKLPFSHIFEDNKIYNLWFVMQHTGVISIRKSEVQ